MESEGAGTRPKPATTKAYPRFQLDSSPFLKALLSYSFDRFGLNMSAAQGTEIIVDVSKFLHFASTTSGHDGTLLPEDLIDIECVKSYFEKIHMDGIESSG